MEEFELVVAEEYKFENWAKRIKIALFGMFGLSRFCCIDENKNFAVRIVLRKWKISDGDLGWRYTGS